MADLQLPKLPGDVADIARDELQQSHRVRAWPLALLVAAWLGILGLMHETLAVMIGVWSSSETYTHAFIVPLISIWLAWRKRAQLRVQPLRPCAWVLAAMVVVAVIWLAGDLMLVNALTQFALIALLVLAVPLVVGIEATRVILFPLGFLFFAVPFGDFLMPQLMEWTASFTVAALVATGVPVYREGLQFVIPSGNWSVVEACSGIRYLIASLMVGTLFAYLNYRSMRRRWVFIAVAIIVPVIANWLRAYMIVMLGHLSSNRLAVGVDHLIYGWIFFGIVILIMFSIGARWSEPDEAEPAQASIGPVAARTSFVWAALAGVSIIGAAELTPWQLHRGDLAAGEPLLQFPAQLADIGGSLAGEPRPLGWEPYFQEPRAKGYRIYGTGTDTVTVDVAYFRAQDYQSKLVNSVHSVIRAEDARWNRQSAPDLVIRWRGQTLSLPATRVKLPPQLGREQSGSILVARAYWVDGEFVTSPWRAKLLNALARLRGRGDDAALLQFSTYASDDAVQLRRLQRLTQALPELSDALLATRARR